MATVIVLAVLLVFIVLAVRTIRRNHLLSECGGDCAHCANGCKRERAQSGTSKTL